MSAARSRPEAAVWDDPASLSVGRHSSGHHLRLARASRPVRDSSLTPVTECLLGNYRDVVLADRDALLSCPSAMITGACPSCVFRRDPRPCAVLDRGLPAIYRRASRLFDELALAHADGGYVRLLGKLARV